MKSYTDLEQSKKLAEILPLESADMCYLPTHIGDEHHFIASLSSYSECTKMIEISIEYCTPCWSLAALLGILPFPVLYREMLGGIILWSCECHLMETDEVVKIEHYDNPVDVCVAMIEKLHELNLL